MAAEPKLKADPISARLYLATLETVPSATSTLLAEYSKIPVEDQKEHITKIRDQAYEKYPYPCLGRWRFLELDLGTHPLYQSDILPALTNKGHKQDESVSDDTDWVFLDLGCCLAQDIRRLIFDGADPSRLRGADLKPEFIEMGYSLFRDKESFPPSHFIAPADVFDFSPSSSLAQLDGKVGILNVCSVFHLFNLDGQNKMAQRVLNLLDPRSKRALVVGFQVANVNAGEFGRRRADGLYRTRYRHNVESWRALWEEAVQAEQWKDIIQGVEVDTRLDGVPARLGDKMEEGLFEEGFRWMTFSVWINFK